MRAEDIDLRPSRDVYRELAALREEVEMLRAQLDRKREQPLDENTIGQMVARLGITANDARLLAAMASGRAMTREQIQDVTCDGEEVSMRNVDSRIKRLRRRVPWARIITIYGLGYMLAAQSAEDVRRFLAGETMHSDLARAPTLRCRAY